MENPRCGNGSGCPTVGAVTRQQRQGGGPFRTCQSKSRLSPVVLQTQLIASTDSHMLARHVPPAAPILRSAPPRGEQWLHEVKFDGWRIQLHKHGGSAAAFTKNGHDHSSRIRWMVDALARLKCVRSLVIDGELVARNNAGLPDFYRLHFHRHDRGLR